MADRDRPADPFGEEGQIMHELIEASVPEQDLYAKRLVPAQSSLNKYGWSREEAAGPYEVRVEDLSPLSPKRRFRGSRLRSP